MQITPIGIISVLCFCIGINGEDLELPAVKLLSKLDSSHDLFVKVSNAVLKKIVDYQILSEKLENWKAVTSDLDKVTKGVRSAAVAHSLSLVFLQSCDRGDNNFGVQ